MPISSRKFFVYLTLALAGILPRVLHAQANAAYIRAQDLEDHDQYDQAAAAYRDALAQEPTSVPAMLGLERVYAQLGRSDSLLPLLDKAIALAPRVTAFRAAQLRTYRSLGERDQMRAAFERWRRDVPHDPTPYREFGRMLIEDGFTAVADTILREGEGATGSGRGFEYELAQLHAAMGLWVPAAVSWREAVANDPFLDQAAIYSLTPAPDSVHDAVRRALAAPPMTVHALAVLASLELAWGEPHAAWNALRTLRPDTAAATVWTDFARHAEESESWLVARDALVAVDAVHDEPELVSRAAADALSGGDAASAAALAQRAERTLDSTSAAMGVLSTHLRALSALGRPQDGERLLNAYAAYVPADQRSRYTRLIAWGWVRIGNLDKAKAALAAAGDAGDDLAQGWLALYGGDLATARKRLKPGGDAPPELLTAIELLQRTKTDRSPDAGRAFLMLARGDTLDAAAAFEQAARAMPDAGALLLAAAARLYAAGNEQPKAIALWASIVQNTPQAPEAPEADLEWARGLLRTGQATAAVDRLEHLILTYPQSALVPQARRELELARRAVPPNS